LILPFGFFSNHNRKQILNTHRVEILDRNIDSENKSKIIFKTKYSDSLVVYFLAKRIVVSNSSWHIRWETWKKFSEVYIKFVWTFLKVIVIIIFIQHFFFLSSLTFLGDSYLFPLLISRRMQIEFMLYQDRDQISLYASHKWIIFSFLFCFFHKKWVNILSNSVENSDKRALNARIFRKFFH
jgi:hypothetical protein